MRSNPLPALLCALLSSGAAFADTPPMRFDFGSATVAEGYTRIGADTLYSPATGYGLVYPNGVKESVVSTSITRDALQCDALVNDKPFFFAIDLPEGNYDVTVHLGDPTGAADTTVKAEARRLMLERIQTPAGPGSIQTHSFTVNVRNPDLANGRRVQLKPRELASFDWDRQLLLEFNGTHAAVAGIEIRRNDDALTVYLAGDDTLGDQTGEPWGGWGQILPRFFPGGVAIANHAESGLSLATFRGAGRLEKIRTLVKPGDYVFIQFGHHDQKETGEGVGPYTTYASNLRDYIDTIRENGALPVLVTPMYRRRFSGAMLYDTHGEFPAAMRLIAEEQKVPCIDLHLMSSRFISALGVENSKKAFVYFPLGAYPGYTKDMKDDTHFSYYGAYEMARCVIEGIRSVAPTLGARLIPGIPTYNPETPADPDSFTIPASPNLGVVTIPTASIQ